MYFTQSNRPKMAVRGGKPREEAAYFGHPSGGFFFCNDRFTASRQLPLIFSVSGLGPDLAFGLSGGDFSLFLILSLSR
jgi:hypothetical protein